MSPNYSFSLVTMSSASALVGVEFTRNRTHQIYASRGVFFSIAFIYLNLSANTFTMGRYDNVDIHVRFAKHPLNVDAHAILTLHYGGIIPDISTIFIDPANRNDLKADAHDQLFCLIIDDMILPIAVNSDRSVVTPLLKRCQIKVAASNGKKSTCLMGIAALTKAMANNVADQGDNCIDIVIHTGAALHFPAVCNFADWNDFTLDPHPSPMAPVLPPQPDVTALIADFTAAIRANPRAAAPPALPVPASRYTVNPRTLAPDVFVTYTKFRENQPITAASVAGTFDNGVRHFQD